MSLPELCIRRPVMTTLLMLTFVVFGIFAYRLLPVSALPRVDFPTIQVSADLSGASPETMAASVAAPLERQFATIAGVSGMTSTSGRGSTSITLQFDLDRNIDGAALDVASAISAVSKRLPPAMTEAPNFRKVNPADFPVLLLALSSPTQPLSTVNAYGEQVFAQQISQLPGVAQVLIFGQQKYAVRVGVDPDKAAARGLTLNDVGNAVAAANSNAPVGALQGLRQNVTLEATGQLTNAEKFRPLVVAFRNGAPIRLDEIADVRDSVTNDQIAACSTTSAPWCWRCFDNRMPIRWMWSTRSAPACQNTRRNCRLRFPRNSSSTARCPSASRWRTCSLRCCCRLPLSSWSSSCF